MCKQKSFQFYFAYLFIQWHRHAKILRTKSVTVNSIMKPHFNSFSALQLKSSMVTRICGKTNFSNVQNQPEKVENKEMEFACTTPN